MNLFSNQLPRHRVAVLIDGDNMPSRNLAEIISYASAYGEVTIRKVFGDWTRPSLAGWKAASAEYGFRLEQATAYTSGKNTSDLAIVMEAMDIRYQQLADTVCIASSDGDFTGIAQRLREAGMRVLGFGAAKTPQSLVTSCSSFHCSGGAHPVPADLPVPAFTDGVRQKGAAAGVSRECLYRDAPIPRFLTHTEPETLKRNSVEEPIREFLQRAQPALLSETDGNLPVQVGLHKKEVAKKGTETKKSPASAPTPQDPIQRDRRMFVNLFLIASLGRSSVAVSLLNHTINKELKGFRLKDYGCKRLANLYEALGFTVEKRKGEKIIRMPS